ncbi:hypothetical protein EIP91_000591 [Steccherinum ochraceum]|uniref:D-xylose 1-dehydrogenase (NADP(+), D-xylono-1,5-lactone-forming) n=1 Tax=Steccherinum ochraceum TaxID=92696 RepID=A0A4R0RTC5_9APHY|nr:hypothetical protein EIP91_000591 [Steccherinum ochraceum]
MAGFFGFVKRVYQINNPPTPTVAPDAPPPLRFGIFGAAKIAPNALIIPAKSHAEVIVTAVAARDLDRAKQYAKKWGIEKAYGGKDAYQELVDDPDIDVIYNPLPNGLHYEWTMKALQAGKHVLLEKPSSNSSEETRKMFELADKKGVVLLEAFHYRFHPATQRFHAIVNSGELGAIKSIETKLLIPKGIIPDGDIRYQFDLGGGSLMDAGCYAVSQTRYVAGANPSQILTAQPTVDPSNPDIDAAFDASFAFSTTESNPNLGNVTASIGSALANPPKWGFIPKVWEIYTTVKGDAGEATLLNYVAPAVYHYIEVKTYGKGGKKRTEKVYTFREWPKGEKKGEKGETWWMTYRYQLEAFVDQIRGRKPQHWVSAQDSIDNMKAIEMIYEKAGLKARPLSTYTPAVDADAGSSSAAA